MEETTNKTGMSIGVVVAVAVVVAIVFGGGTYAYVNNKAEKEKKDLQAQITELQGEAAATKTATAVATTTPSSTTSTTAVASNETASWKTYTNSTYGFSFKYPATYAAEDVDNGVQINVTSDINQIPIFEVTTQKSSLTLQKYVDDKISSSVFADASATTFAGLAAFEGVDQGMVSSYGIITKNSIGIIELICSANNTNKLSDVKASLTNIQKQILSTFQFTK